MAAVPHNGWTALGVSLPAGAEDEAMHRLSDEALRAAWRRIVGKAMPRHLPNALLMHILAYQRQARQHGDLSRHALMALKQAARQADGEHGDRGAAPSPRVLKPGTVLVREHDGAMHRVMVMADGFAWQGHSYASLSAVAFAITGTRWNGHRFFGLRPGKRSAPQRVRP